jgi:LysM repeat protein
MADEILEALKLKYMPVFEEMETRLVRVHDVYMEGDKLVIRAVAPTAEEKDRVWDQIKYVDPSCGDLIAEITVAQAAQARAVGMAAPEPIVYTVQPGDTLSKIARNYYGDADQSARIFEANRDRLDDPDTIQPGQRLVIPQ